ncbi:MAG: HlyD family efflux transporter periplasmic adaptor subunit [Tissierellia bacterium]|nr:HlyD family efflux transporter periplasmic adaptor subunit [Tissierellia bacterium]
MERRKKRIRAKYRKRRRLLFLGLILLMIPLAFLAFSGFRRARARKLKTSQPKRVTYRSTLEGQAYLLLREKVYLAKGDGVVVYHAQEGDKVAKDYLVANMNLMNDNSKVKDQLVLIQAALDYKQNKGGAKSSDQGPSEEDINIMRNIQKFIRDEDYEKLIASINSLDLNTKQTVNISDLNDLLKLSTESLNEEKDRLSKKLSTTSADYEAEFSGVVSFIVDDPKGLLDQDKDPEDFSPGYVASFEEKNLEAGKNHLSKKEPIYRLIDNLDWSMAILIRDQDQIRGLAPGDKIQLNLGQEDLVTGEVQKINKDHGQAVLVVEIQDNFYNYYQDRVQEVKLVKKEVPAYEIPAKALIKNDKGQLGVYREGVRGFVQFVPVDLIKRNKDKAYVLRPEGEDPKRGQGLDLYDYVIGDPKGIKKEQIVN